MTTENIETIPASPTPIDYKAELEKLTPEKQEEYLSGWRNYLDKLPRQAYVGQLTQLSQRFGPEFASRVIQPELQFGQVEPPPVTEVPAAALEPEVPWYQKPLKWAGEQPAFQPILKGLDAYYGKWITPAAMSLGTAFSPRLREQLGGRAPFSVPEEERSEMWAESKLPWLAKTGLELIVDPSFYFGWGLAPKAVAGLEKAGFKTLAKVLKPVASAETAYIKAAQVPVKAAGRLLKKTPAIIPDIAELRATGRLVLKKPFEESVRSIVNNIPVHTYDALHNLGLAGEVTGKPLSQILSDFLMGIPDERLLKTITSPNQQRALRFLQQNASKLDLDTIIGIADRHPDTAASVLGWKQVGLVAKELGLPAPRMAPGVLGSFQRIGDRLYAMWRKMVLQTPWYTMQNTVENPLREALVNVRHIWDITDYAKLPSFADQPIDIQRRIVSLVDRLNKKIPAHIASPFARTAGTGGMTEAAMGQVALGKTYLASTVAAYMDDSGIVNTYFTWYDRYAKSLMQSNSPETASALAKITGLYDDALRAVDDKGVALVDTKLLEQLKNVSISGSADDVTHAFAEIQRNKTLTIAKAINEMEKGLPDVVRSKIKSDLPRLWAKNDINGIHRLFEELKRTMPQRIETYQKQLMVQRLRGYRDLLRTGVPKKYQPFVTRVLNSFKLDKVSEAEARLSSAKSLSEFQRAMFKASTASRRELEVLMEATMITEAIARGVDDKVLSSWYNISQQVNRRAFKAGEELVERTFNTANVIRFAKNPGAIASTWDDYIRAIQSEFPEIADSLRAMATPDTDSLWSAYRSIQERRWFNVGQEKLRAMGIDFDQFPRVIGANGKLLTQEDFLKSQLAALKGWEGRAVVAWDKRHIAPTAKNKLLDMLREETIRAKEAIALQSKQIQNQAKDLALDVTYSTFGNYAQRTNLDDFMNGIGMPFWYFPSRSIPFYITQSIQRPRLGIEIMNLQQSQNESEQPSRLFGTINIPGTDFWYNPLQASMWWQLADRRNFIPAGMGNMETGMEWMRNNLAISFGPQWRIATALVERMMGKQFGGTPLTMEPQPIIPQQRWLDAVAGLKLPVISPIASLLNEPFDMYLRAVYGETVANWQQREVEKYIVDMGYNPQTASKEVVQDAWKKYYTRQLLSIPGGAVKEMTPTEMARFEAINEKSKELGLTKTQRVTLRQLGESPFTGLRQDQIEAIYADVPAQKLWRYIRPWGLTAESRPIWEDYIQFKLGRETLLYGSDPDNPAEGSRLYNERKFDTALQRGRISPREWKALYRQSYADYISRVKQLGIDYNLAPKTEADWEAYRQMLGWDEPVRHPDDIKLDEYYMVMDSSQFENDLGEFNYDAYRKAEMQFFAGLSPDTLAYIKSRKDRYKTPLRSAYSRDMEKVQPYYDLQSAVLAQYPPEIAQIIEYALATPDIAIQRAILINYPQAMIALRRINVAKQQWRAKNPEADKILRYWSS